MLEKKEKVLQKKAAAEVEKAKDFTKAKNKRGMFATSECLGSIQNLYWDKFYFSQVSNACNIVNTMLFVLLLLPLTSKCAWINFKLPNVLSSLVAVFMLFCFLLSCIVFFSFILSLGFIELCRARLLGSGD